jgi:Cadherin-like beta sandwich domain
MVHKDVSYFPYTKVGVDQSLAVSYHSPLLLRFTLMNLPHHASGERDYITMRTLTVVRQYLTPAFLLVIGLVAYGCGDSATVSEPAELGNLSASTGTLQPPFNPATTDYTVQLSSDVSSTTISASPRVAGDTIRIDNQQTTSQTVTLDSPGAEKSVSIVVTDSGAGGGSKSYTVRIRRDLEDNSLQDLSVSSGTLAPDPFDKNTLDYTVNNIGTSVTSITISATKSDSNSVMQLASVTVPPGTASGQATVQLGGTGSATPVSIDITRPSGSKKTYTVTINRGASGNNNLRGLTIPPGTLTFRASTTSYTVNVASNVTSVTIRPTLADTTASMTVNQQATDSGQGRTITLNGPDSINVVTIDVTAQNGTQKRYTVSVFRAALGGNNNLSGLTVSPGSLAFDPGTTSYTVNVGSSVTSVTVTPTRQDSNATITVNGTPATSGQARTIQLGDAGTNTPILIIVTAQNSSQKTYTANVIRAALGGNNNLSALTVSPGPLNSAFDPDDQTYSVNVASTVDSITVTPTRQNSNATITMNGTPATSGQGRSITLNGAGSNTVINIIVTAQNGSQKLYTVEVSRAALGGNNNLSALTVSPGPLNSAFDPDDQTYSVNVASTVNSITVTPTRQNSNATITVNGTPATSGQGRSITLNGAGSNTLINIVVTAPNGSQKPYTITVDRAALGGNNNLSGLTVSPGPLTPAFTAATTSYTVDVASTVANVSVTPARQDSNATITVNGTPATSGQGRSVTLNGAGSNTLINIVVTAPNGSQKPYTITVERAALGANNNLSGLTVSPGTLSPAFTAARTAYAVNNVGSSATAILLTATPQDSSATVTINGQGGNSRSIPLPGGPSSTEIEVLVIAPNGSNRTYLVTVNQPAPAAPPAPPASAPDLITEDDSCSPGVPPDECAPGTTKEDNVTSFTAPRFRVPQPAEGETPSLYVDGAKVAANVDQGANTLAPTAALSDGVHTITSTVTNAGGLESPQSPSLTVTIDTVAPGGQ